MSKKGNVHEIPKLQPSHEYRAPQPHVHGQPQYPPGPIQGG